MTPFGRHGEFRQRRDPIGGPIVGVQPAARVERLQRKIGLSSSGGVRFDPGEDLADFLRGHPRHVQALLESAGQGGMAPLSTFSCTFAILSFTIFVGVERHARCNTALPMAPHAVLGQNLRHVASVSRRGGICQRHALASIKPPNTSIAPDQPMGRPLKLQRSTAPSSSA